MEKLHIQPSQLDMLPYYEYEYTVEIYNDIMKERNDEESKQYAQNDPSSMKSDMDKNYKSFKQPKMPKMPKMPKISAPKF